MTPHTYSPAHAVTHKDIITQSMKRGWWACARMEIKWKPSSGSLRKSAEQSMQVSSRPGESGVLIT